MAVLAKEHNKHVSIVNLFNLFYVFMCQVCESVNLVYIMDGQNLMYGKV